MPFMSPPMGDKANNSHFFHKTKDAANILLFLQAVKLRQSMRQYAN